ncbi:MAG: hypothetical protein HUU25_10690 [Candidatus Sumerlaeia bacterium]|nr:hypothetical protein [Candidatus Sumerlaeia bacterium]
MFSAPTKLAENPLWDREFRSGRRLWCLQSWPVPLAVLLIYGLHFALGDPLDADVEVTLLGVTVWLAPYETFLLLWAVWRVCSAMARDSAEAAKSTLGVLVVAPRALALAKSLGACYPSLLALWGILLCRLFNGSAFQILPNLSFDFWGLSMWYSAGEWRSLWAPLRVAISIAETASRLVLFPLVAVTFASWLAARFRSASVPFAFTIMAGLTLLTCVVSVFYALSAMSGVMTCLRGQPVESPLATQVAAGLGVAFTLALHVVIPAAWLLWWWRWTARGTTSRRLPARCRGGVHGLLWPLTTDGPPGVARLGSRAFLWSNWSTTPRFSFFAAGAGPSALVVGLLWDCSSENGRE